MTEQTFTVSLDTAQLFTGDAIRKMLDELHRAEKCGYVIPGLARGVEVVKAIKSAGAKPAPSVRVYVDGAEIEDAVSVDEVAMTVTRLANDDHGEPIVNSRTGEPVSEVIAARREIRIVRG